MLGSEASGNKTKEMYYSLLSPKMISFVLFPLASQPSLFSQLAFEKSPISLGNPLGWVVVSTTTHPG